MANIGAVARHESFEKRILHRKKFTPYIASTSKPVPMADSGTIARHESFEKRRSSSSFEPGTSSISSEVEYKHPLLIEGNKGKGKGKEAAGEAAVLQFLQFWDPPLDFWYERLVDYGLDSVAFLNSFAKWPAESIEKILNDLAADTRFPLLSKFQTQCLVRFLEESPYLSRA